MHVFPVASLSSLVRRSIVFTSSFFASFILQFGIWSCVPITNLCFVTPLVTTFLVVADNTREQGPNAIRRATVAFPIHNVFSRLDSRNLGNARGGQTLLEG